MRSDVEFPGFGGVTLRGWLYRPSGDGPFPAVVLAHGFSATRHMGLSGYADALVEAGYAALVYDHRCLGDSDGEPRQEINPWAQARDYRYALTWLSAQPDIDPSRLAIWGSSFSGGEVLVVGAIDPRVKAVIANAPFAGLSTEPPAGDLQELFEAMKAALEDESGAGPADSQEPPIGPLSVTRSPGSDPNEYVYLGQPESIEWFNETGGPGSAWVNSFTLRGMSGEPRFDPAVAAPFISPKPLLMVVATGDVVAPADVARATFASAGEPKSLELIEGHHFVPYSGAELAQASGAMVEFLNKYL